VGHFWWAGNVATVQLMKHCATCGHKTLHVQQAESNVFHLLMTLVTFGLWLIVWLTAPIRQRGAQCTQCGHSWFTGFWSRLSAPEKLAAVIASASLVVIVIALVNINPPQTSASLPASGPAKVSLTEPIGTSSEGRSSTEEAPSAIDKWFINESKSPIDDSTTISIGRPSSHPYDTRFGEDKFAYLLIRCQENHTDVIVGADEFLALLGPVKVVVRFDELEASSQSWSLASGNNAAFSPAPIRLIRQMLASRKLVVRLHPANAAYVTAGFNLDGLDAVVGRLQEACHWN